MMGSRGGVWFISYWFILASICCPGNLSDKKSIFCFISILLEDPSDVGVEKMRRTKRGVLLADFGELQNVEEKHKNVGKGILLENEDFSK
ncbi:hypothetical protein Taro_004816 [Colocasia esculenta]|uniref:Uncharacterized protein n=1 Tax=Colocasia esculenta TaxID=4460 RepID=A0A843TND8_COLES|nr:hypothetical protein [Colocasia esculenta]